MLVDIEGRKQLYFFSEGFDLGIDTVHEYTSNTTETSLARAFTRVLAELRRTGWTIDAVDAAGLRGAESTPTGLLFLAQETGGVLVHNDNDLSRGVMRALERHAVSYVLTIDVGDVAADGRFHPLEVRLRRAPRGTRVEHRCAGALTAPVHSRRGVSWPAARVASRARARTDERRSARLMSIWSGAAGWHLGRSSTKRERQAA